MPSPPSMSKDDAQPRESAYHTQPIVIGLITFIPEVPTDLGNGFTLTFH